MPNLNHYIMNEFIKKHWINALGLGLIFTGVLYFLKLAIENGWLPIELRVALSTTLGLVGVYVGYRKYSEGAHTLGEVLAGMGCSVLYATIGYLSFTEGINWSVGALLISMALISITVSILAFKKDMRILFLISLLGGLITPFFIEAVYTMDLPLFVYMLVLNLSALSASIYKGWDEMKVISFVGSIALFAVYYSLFDPDQWGKPFFYVSSIFSVYTLGLLFSSYRKDKDYEGWDLILGVINSIHFVFWSVIIFKQFSMAHALPLLMVGLVFLGIATFIYLTTGRKVSVGLGVYAVLGLTVLAIAGHDMGLLFLEGGLNHVISAGIWLLTIGAIYTLARKFNLKALAAATILPFIGLISYWYKVAWDVEWVELFGMRYIPFFNAGALIWIGLVVLAFSYSRFLLKRPIDVFADYTNLMLSNGLALIGHVLVGGLLSIQIMNLWEAYDLHFISKGLSLSLCWFVYSLILFLWGSRSRQRLFSTLGAFVLVVSTCKVFLWDLSGDSSIQKVIFLLVLGGITLLIAKVRGSAVNSIPASHVPDEVNGPAGDSGERGL